MTIKTSVTTLVMASLTTLAASQNTTMPDTQTLQQMTARFAPTDITADLSKLSAADRRVLAKLVEASRVVDALFLRQVWVGNEAMLLDLARDQSTEGRARLHYFIINKGPWSRLDHNRPFVPGVPAKPEAANFYPDGVSKADLERWIQSLSETERVRADSASCRTTSSISRSSCGRPRCFVKRRS